MINISQVGILRTMIRTVINIINDLKIINNSNHQAVAQILTLKHQSSNTVQVTNTRVALCIIDYS